MVLEKTLHAFVVAGSFAAVPRGNDHLAPLIVSRIALIGLGRRKPGVPEIFIFSLQSAKSAISLLIGVMKMLLRSTRPLTLRK